MSIQSLTHEQWKKHKEAINWFYEQPKGTKIWEKECGTTKWVLVETPNWFTFFDYAINDRYSNERKGIIDGLDIEYKYIDFTNSWTKWSECTYIETDKKMLIFKDYRIKPNEPKFKVGDFVRVKEAPDNVYKIANIDGNEIYSNDCIVYNTPEQLELWKPKEGEWCWVWNCENVTPLLVQFVSYDDKGLLFKHSYCYYGAKNEYWENYEPFIGSLPSILKDE